MAVIDESGVRLGTVERVRMGEPDAVTTGGAQEDDSVGVAVAPANSPGGSTAFGGAMPVMGAGGEEAEVPDPLRTRLRRVGFIEVDGSDLHGADRYIPGDRVADVTGDTVRLGPSATRTTGSTEPMPSVQASSLPATASAEPMLRTALGTPQYVRSAGSPALPWLWRVAAGGSALLGVSAVAGAWLYRRRQQHARPAARLGRSLKSLADNLPEDNRTRLAGLGGGLLLTLIMGTMLSRAGRAATITPSVMDAGPVMTGQGRAGPLRQRRRSVRVAVGLVLGGLTVGVGVLLRKRTQQQAVEYIGRPGVESAAGRDRTRTGELPPDFGIEDVRR
jgi:hypothetical protein